VLSAVFWPRRASYKGLPQIQCPLKALERGHIQKKRRELTAVTNQDILHIQKLLCPSEYAVKTMYGCFIGQDGSSQGRFKKEFNGSVPRKEQMRYFEIFRKSLRCFASMEFGKELQDILSYSLYHRPLQQPHPPQGKDWDRPGEGAPLRCPTEGVNGALEPGRTQERLFDLFGPTERVWRKLAAVCIPNWGESGDPEIYCLLLTCVSDYDGIVFGSGPEASKFDPSDFFMAAVCPVTEETELAPSSDWSGLIDQKTVRLGAPVSGLMYPAVHEGAAICQLLAECEGDSLCQK